MKKQKEVIAVIGGGSVGISFLTQFLDEAIKLKIHNKFEILLFEPQPIVGPGYAYQADYECNLLNTRADTMSIKSKEKSHFIQWLKDHESKWRPAYPDIKISNDAFLPRSLFGQYLMNAYETVLNTCEKLNISFHHIHDEAIDIVPVAINQYCIDTKNSGGFIANHIFLCSGNLPSSQFKHLENIPGYFNSPYPCLKMTAAISATASVGIVGTSLSAIDAVLSLREARHQGNIICVSRNGRFPSVRGGLNKPHQLKKLTKAHIDLMIKNNGGSLTLKTIGQILLDEYQAVTGENLNLDEVLNANTGMHDYISTEIKLSKSVERIWQSIIYASNEIIDYIWHKLPQKEKYIFNNYFRSQWLAYRVSFPLANAEKIYEQLRTNQLQVFAGVEKITYDENEKVFLIYIHDKKIGFKSIIKCDYIVNATSFDIHVKHCEVPLVKNLLNRGLAVAHEFGGFNVDFATGSLINKHGKLNQYIKILGSLSTGVYFWTNAMDVNSRLAYNQACQLAIKLNEVKQTHHNNYQHFVETGKIRNNTNHYQNSLVKTEVKTERNMLTSIPSLKS